MMGSTNDNGWDAEEIFHKYLYDYLMKNKMHKTAEVFARESNANVCPVAIEPPQSFLAEWWSIFYDMYCSMPPKHVEATETVLNKGKQVQGISSYSPCSEISKFMVNPQSSVQLPIGSDCENMLAQMSSKAYEGENHKRMTGNFDTNSQTSSETWNNSKLTGSSPSNSQPKSRKQGQKRQEKKRVGCQGSIPIVSSTYAETISSGSETVLNSAPLKGWPLFGANQVPPRLSPQVLNSYLQSAPNQQQVDMPLSQNQQEIFNQFLASAPAKVLSSFSLTPDSNMLLGTGIDKTSGQDVRVEERSIGENIEMFFSEYDDHVNAPFTLQHSSTSYEKNGHTGKFLKEVGSLRASKGKIYSCNFSPNGRLLACAGQDKKALIWNMDTLGYTTFLESHAHLISDIRFHPSSEFFATSSFDKTVQIWAADGPKKSLSALTGHDDHVMSLDFHPTKPDILCSSDSNNEIRLWDIKAGACLAIDKGATRQVRFHPQGRLLAAASGNDVNIFNVETGSFDFELKGHESEVRSICWDVTGNYIVTVSEESVRLWSMLSGGICMCDLHSRGRNFQSCSFHPGQPLSMIIGSYQLLGSWNPLQTSRIDTIRAHTGFIASLASSPARGLVASAGHDLIVKLWK